MKFDELTRGQQYLVLRDRDLEILIKGLRVQINYNYYLLEKYPEAYTPKEKEEILQDIEFFKRDIEYYSKELKGGAENVEFHTESNSESPSDRFTGLSCTTV